MFRTTKNVISIVNRCRLLQRRWAFVVGDLPFGSFEVSTSEAVHNACRLVKEGSVAAVKLEGGKVRKNTVRAIVDAGIPVIGHVGLTPQTANSFGGFRVQGKSAQAAANIFEDALALQEAGCSALVIEFVPELLGQAITKGLTIPTFGIGAGRHTSGQVLVYHDMLGMYPNFTPKFCKQYVNLAEEITKGITAFKEEVEGHQFPAPVHTFPMKIEEWEKAHDLILQAHPQKEGADNVVANALAQVKASLVVESLKPVAETASVSKLENSTIENRKSEPTIQKQLQQPKPIQSKQESKQETKQEPQSTPSTPAAPNPLPSRPQTWVSTLVTNFELYYNSYNNEEDANNEIYNNNVKSGKRTQKMKV